MDGRKEKGREKREEGREGREKGEKKRIRLLHRLGIFPCVSMWTWAQRADMILQRNLVK